MPRAPRRLVSAWAVWLGVGLLVSLLEGCAFFHSEAPSGELSQRILPPMSAATLDQVPLVSAPVLEQLPKPRELPPAGEEPSEPPVSGEEPTCGSLKLEQAIEPAFRQNPGLDVFHERIAQAEGGKQVAFAGFLPEAKLSYRRIQGETNTGEFTLANKRGRESIPN